MSPPTSESLSALFAQPPAAFRGKPFWSWNGELDREELLRQVRVFKEMGMGGFFMHSRTGLRTEYLGEEWFDLINACADEAGRLGMEAWLYDEDRWPSGSAGGLATADPRFRMKVLRCTVVEGTSNTQHPTSNIQWPERAQFVAAFVARVEGLAFTDCERLDHGMTPPDDGRAVLVFTTETWAGHSFYNGHTYLDTLQRAATDHFLAITHERYRARCGERLGHTIRGIFTDEPHHGTVMCENNENRAARDQRWTTPWTESLWEDFERAWGYDLRAHLPELFLQPEGRRVSQVKWHYMELLQRMFLENWARPLHEWCQRHGMQLTGHVLHEDSLVAQAVPGGSAMRYYEHMDVPGVDVLALHNRNFWIVKQLASAARQLGKKWLLSELYGCTGWPLDFAGHKRIGAWQALLGINVRCHHLAWVTMSGEAKRDYPASIHFQSAWWRRYAAVEDYFARLHTVLQRGEPVCDVLVLNPVESTWAQIHPGWAQWLGALDPELEKIERTYRDVFAWLSAAHIDFDYGDEDHLARLGSVETGGGEPLLRLGAMTYRVAVVAGLLTIRGSTLRLLREFVQAGGTVIFAGETPPFVDALPSPEAGALAAEAHAVPLDEPALVGPVRAHSRTLLRLDAGGPEAARDLFCQLRRDGDTLLCVVINTSETEWHRDVRFRFNGVGEIEEWEPATGARYRQPFTTGDGSLSWLTDLPPLGERIFVITPRCDPALAVRAAFTDGGSVQIDGPLAYELDEPNVCVLDFAQHQLGSGAWQPALEILQLDAQLRAQLGIEPRSGVMLQPWAAAKQPAPDFTPVPLRLRFRFEALALTPVELLIEQPHLFRIALNGHAIDIPADTAWFIDPCFRRVPLPALQLGGNDLLIETAFTPDTEIEAIYLLGAFGVALDGGHPRLTALPALLDPCDTTQQGLPFYSGKITYRLPLPRHARAAQLEIGSFGGAVARVRAPDAADGPLIAWPPYRADIGAALPEILCEIWLTRRNTFGPLHLTPLDQPFIGPASFRAEDDTFTPSYVLQPSGLLQPPRVVFPA